jgi:hypothetical protein
MSELNCNNIQAVFVLNGDRNWFMFNEDIQTHLNIFFNDKFANYVDSVN